MFGVACVGAAEERVKCLTDVGHLGPCAAALLLAAVLAQSPLDAPHLAAPSLPSMLASPGHCLQRAGHADNLHTCKAAMIA